MDKKSIKLHGTTHKKAIITGLITIETTPVLMLTNSTGAIKKIRNKKYH